LGFLSEMFMVASIPSYLPAEDPQISITTVKEKMLELRAMAVTLLMFNLFYASPLVLVSPFFFVSGDIWLLFLLLVTTTYIVFLRWTHQRSELFYSERLRSSFILSDVQRYFKGQVIAVERHDSKQYIFGFHPHGTLPATAWWCQTSIEWKQKVLSQDLVTLVGSQLLGIPIVREVSMAAGGRDVSWKSFSNALEEKRSMLLIPGGIAEMRHSSSYTDEITIITKHKGFIRMALQYGVDLVPVFSFGETKLLDPCLPSIHKIFQQYLGIPFPLWIGRFVQVPRSFGITVVVGKSISVQRQENPSQEEVDALHKLYFEELYKLFEQHKDKYGHVGYKLILLPSTK